MQIAIGQCTKQIKPNNNRSRVNKVTNDQLNLFYWNKFTHKLQLFTNIEYNMSPRIIPSMSWKSSFSGIYIIINVSSTLKHVFDKISSHFFILFFQRQIFKATFASLKRTYTEHVHFLLKFTLPYIIIDLILRFNDGPIARSKNC